MTGSWYALALVSAGPVPRRITTTAALDSARGKHERAREVHGRRATREVRLKHHVLAGSALTLAVAVGAVFAWLDAAHRRHRHGVVRAGDERLLGTLTSRTPVVAEARPSRSS